LRYSGIAAAVALLWIAAGAGLYLQNKHQQDAIAARQVAIRAKGAAEHAASQAKANLHIWENLPRAEEILSACNEQWAKLDFGKHGWVLSNWNCSADTTGITIETEWDRLGGLAKYAPGQLKSDGNHSADSHSVPIAWQSFSGDAESDAQSDRDIWTLAQLYGLGLKLEQDTGAVKIVDPEGKQIPRPWSQTGANFSLIAPPWFVPGTKAFDKVAGLRLTRINFDTHSQSWGVVATLYSMHELRPVPVEHDTTVKSLPVGRAEVPLALAISVQSPVKQSLVSEAGSSAIAQPQSRVNFDTRPSSASEIARPTVSVATDNGTAEEADGTTTVLPLSNSLTQSASAVSPASNVSIGMGALALAQQAQRAKHFQASQPATKTQSGAQALTPPGLGD